MSSEEVFVFPASFAQQRLWFLDQLIPDNGIYNVPTVIRLTGSLKLAALEQTFNEIVLRHETLRTTFIVSDGQPLQAIAPSLTIPLSVLDLQQLPDDEQEVKAKSIITAEIERPFDLSSGPLLRVTLLVLSKTEHILLLNMHHIICDDWSMGVLIRELGTLYAAFAQNQPSPLLELPLQYADFAHWQREWLQGEVLQTQLAYWREQLNDISILHLPTDKPRPAIQSYQGSTQFLELPLKLIDALEKLSQQEGVTLFMTLLAAFQTLLYRYTHQEDIAVGSPIANRNHSEIEGIIGFFVNSLVLRSNLSGNPTFRELLGRVREVTLGAYSHQDLPFEKLVEELHPERNLSHHPLFQVVFGFQNAPMSALELPGLVPSFMNIDIKKTRFDLELHLWKCSEDFRSLWGGNWEYSEGLRGVMVYNTDLFDKATISRMVEHFKTLLSAIVANPEERIANLPLLSEVELHQVLVEWNNTQADYPQDKCIHQLFEEKVQQYPDSIAVNFANEQLTYQELNTRSNKLAHHLQKSGVCSEVLVGICISQSIEMIVGLLGILKAGGTYVPLDPSYPQERLNFMLEDAQVSVLLTQENLLKHFEGFSKPIISIDKDWEIITQEKQDNPESDLNSDNLAYVIYTSGSTGKPKGVAVPHKAVNRLVCNANYINLLPSDKVAQASNASFDAATFEIWGALLNGAQLVGITKDVTLSPPEFALQLREKGINILFLTTALFQQIARDVPQAFTSLRYLLFGGETVDKRWVKKIIKYGVPKHLIHVYGPTENTTFSSYYYVQDLPLATSFPIGRPITNTQTYILDAHLQPVPIGVTGELYMGGEGLAREYLNRTELTAEHFSTHTFSNKLKTRLYKTGDLARYLPDGNIEFLGRIDNQVKIRGFRIELSEIEAVLNQHPAVRETVVIVGEDVPDDKYLVAYVVLNQEQIAMQEVQGFASLLRQFLKEKLPEYMVPSAYVILESLPLTHNGKVDRRALPMPDTISFNNQDYVAPRSQVEKLLAQIWAKVLGKEQVGIHDNFFELGGHSLLATQLTSRIRDTFQIDLPVRNLFEAPTVEQLSRYVDTIYWTAKGIDKTETTEIQREEVEF
ncbi:non-ribosomal peptide synthetase [Nostoc sp. 'Peltigera membranacea cyanobiont' 210A]|uniref:non-ribosomal peptide synthetase n=1 Tax=Nostoc sp. 'Peltigera membranacea cyanobiont' 210A TaxID=2014529 RepID=UPI000B95B6B3|nr:non-ribosomal peptide synthetase [Nostoc sp. 'Peltigera membranacea cyanobiont' 210A]OYD97753.1 non-ribosomal peptide synthetase [Nostoc sp. 'Peltigera membranacea cyanobiont' 210A]